MVPPPAAATSPAHVLSLVKQASTLRPEDIEGLAAALLDLGSGYESGLRTVISMQRLLERIRRAEHVSPESALLLQEMSRHFAALRDSGSALRTCIDHAGACLSAMKGDQGE